MDLLFFLIPFSVSMTNQHVQEKGSGTLLFRGRKITRSLLKVIHLRSNAYTKIFINNHQVIYLQCPNIYKR